MVILKVQRGVEHDPARRVSIRDLLLRLGEFHHIKNVHDTPSGDSSLIAFPLVPFSPGDSLALDDFVLVESQ